MPETGQTATNTEPQRISEDMMSALVPVKLDGREELRPLSEVIGGYQKKTVAEKRFQEASVKEQAAETAMRVLQDLQEGRKKGDAEALARAFRNAGWSEEDISAMFEPTGGAAGGQSDDDQRSHRQYGQDGAADGDDGDDDEKLQLRQEIAELKQVVGELQGAYKKAQEGAKVRTVQAQVHQAVETDPHLSRILRNASPEDRDWVLELARSSCNKASKTLPWGPRAIQAGLEDLKRRLKAIGAGRSAGSGASDDEDASDDGTVYPDDEDDDTGFGPSSTSGNRLHQVSSQGKRVSVREDGYINRVRDILSRSMRRNR